MLSTNRFLINGAGPVGLSIAMLLLEKKHSVEIFEKRSDPRLFSERGRSINLALSDRGFRALGILGLEKLIKTDAAIAMKGRMIHDEAGNTHLQPYSASGKSIYSVSRSLLNNVLLDEAEKRGLKIHFDQKCTGFDLAKNEIYFENATISTLNTSVLACDGAFSPLRHTLKTQSNFSHQETKLDYSYKEFTIPAGENGSWKMEKHALHIWPRKSFMLIALPNTDGSFTCTLFFKSSQIYFTGSQNLKEARAFFKTHFPDALALMLGFEDDFEHNPVSSLFMETCSPWNFEDKLLLLGDAAHAIVPFYGQGLNAGLEDVRLLFEEMESAKSTSLAFSDFQQKRKKDADAIGELALQNFVEMRDLVTDDMFLKKKKLESALKKIYQDKWLNQYELVTFSHSPYSIAQKQGFENDHKLELILANQLLSTHLLEDTVTEQDMYLLSSIVL